MVGRFARRGKIAWDYRRKAGTRLRCEPSQSRVPALRRITVKSTSGIKMSEIRDSDPRDKLFEKMAIEGVRVKPFDGFIFLCGGLVDASAEHPPSLRDAIYREAAKLPDIINRIRLAEEFKDWAEDGHYQDLLTFEEHIAELSNVIVLALESPGSLAELGMFSAMESFRSKLIVFIATSHYEQSSFIKLGPVKFLETSHNNPCEVFPWMTTGARSVVDADWLSRSSGDVIEALVDRLSPVKTEVQFSQEKWLHVTLLICDFILVMSALTVTEIVGYLSRLGIQESMTSLKQRLFILEKMELISVIARSNQRFYVSSKSEFFLNFRISPKELDLSRLQVDTISFYEKEDRRRHKALFERRRVGI